MADYPDFEGQKSKLYSGADWAAIKATDKNSWASDTNKATTQYVQLTYTVPAGKTLYITQLGGSSHATAAADRDSNQICAVQLWIGASCKWEQGGNGGTNQSFLKPYAITTGVVLTLFCINYANHNCDLRVGFGGYEVTN